MLRMKSQSVVLSLSLRSFLLIISSSIWLPSTIFHVQLPPIAFQLSRIGQLILRLYLPQYAYPWPLLMASLAIAVVSCFLILILLYLRLLLQCCLQMQVMYFSDRFSLNNLESVVSSPSFPLFSRLGTYMRLKIPRLLRTRCIARLIERKDALISFRASWEGLKYTQPLMQYLD